MKLCMPVLCALLLATEEWRVFSAFILQHSTYGMGWMVVPPSADYAFCQDQRYVVSHTGGAIGASSVLLILPKG
jgi:hypothetical protein